MKRHNGVRMDFVFKFIDLNDAEMKHAIAKHSLQKIQTSILEMYFHSGDCAKKVNHQCYFITQDEFESVKLESAEA